MKLLLNLAVGIAGCALLCAQDRPTVVQRLETFEAVAPPSADVTTAVPGAKSMAYFVSADAVAPNRSVKGAPYSGEGVTEFTQTLADGTRIQRKSTSKIARDSEGRTREERSLGMVGPWATGADTPQIATITDPVAGVLYSINLTEKTARSFKIPSGGELGAKTIMAQRTAPSNVRIEQHTIMAGPGVAIAGSIVGGVPGGPPPPLPPADVLYRTSGEAPKTDSLGTQTMEGLRVEGTRTTTVVPAGMIGNDRELVTTFERWISPELQTVVMSTVKDPQSGETVYRLTGISRSEPDKSLFQVPADIKIEKGPEPMMIKRKLDAEQNRNSQPVR